MYYETAPENEFALTTAVLDAYEQYPSAKLNRMGLTFQGCLNGIIETAGDNTYTIPHMNKEKLEREGRLPRALDVSDAVGFWDGKCEEEEEEDENYDETDSSVG